MALGYSVARILLLSAVAMGLTTSSVHGFLLFRTVQSNILSQRTRNHRVSLGLSSRALVDDTSATVNSVPLQPMQEMETVGKASPLQSDDVDISEAIPSLSLAPPKERKFTPFQTFARMAPIVTLAAYAVNQQPFDEAVSAVWSVIYNWAPAHNSLFEAEVAVAGFWMWVIPYMSIHIVLGPEKTKQTRFDGKMPVDPFEWTRPEGFYLWFNPMVSYLGSIWLYHLIHAKAPLPEVAPTFGVLCAEVFFGVWLYDLIFYPIHVLYHKSSWGEMRKAHGYHHRASSHGLTSFETVQNSYLDGFLQVAVNILVQQISPFGGHKHVLSRIIHNLVVTYMLTEIHTGYDLPWMTHNIWPEVFGGSPRHEKHHHDGRVYYHQYFKYIDDFFGFTEEKVLKNKKKEERELKSGETGTLQTSMEVF